MMFRLRAQRVFSAAHAIVIAGEPEVVHEHDWRVRLVVEGSTLDDDGLLCDFHLLETLLDEAIAPLSGRNLNETPPFDRINPTAERVAQHLLDVVMPGLPGGLARARMSVTEAPGCEASCSCEVTT